MAKKQNKGGVVLGAVCMRESGLVQFSYAASALRSCYRLVTGSLELFIASSVLRKM